MYAFELSPDNILEKLSYHTIPVDTRGDDDGLDLEPSVVSGIDDISLSQMNREISLWWSEQDQKSSKAKDTYVEAINTVKHYLDVSRPTQSFSSENIAELGRLDLIIGVDAVAQRPIVRPEKVSREMSFTPPSDAGPAFSSKSPSFSYSR